MIKVFISLVKSILTIIRLTYTPSFYKNFVKNIRYWFLLFSKGYISLEQQESDNSITIQTIFFLFGDVNVNIHKDVVASENTTLVESHIKAMQKFKEQVLFFLPTFISIMVHFGSIIFTVLYILKKWKLLI